MRLICKGPHNQMALYPDANRLQGRCAFLFACCSCWPFSCLFLLVFCSLLRIRFSTHQSLYSSMPPLLLLPLTVLPLRLLRERQHAVSRQTTMAYTTFPRCMLIQQEILSIPVIAWFICWGGIRSVPSSVPGARLALDKIRQSSIRISIAWLLTRAGMKAMSMFPISVCTTGHGYKKLSVRLKAVVTTSCWTRIRTS